MRRLLILAAFLVCAGPAWAQCSNTAYGSYTCIQSCHNGQFSVTATTCAFGSNLTAGSIIYVGATNISNTTSTFTFTGCSLTWTTLCSTTGGTAGSGSDGTAANSGSGSCTITATSTGSAATLDVIAVEIKGSNQTVDKSSIKTTGTIGSGSNISGTSITTTVNGDLVMEFASGTNTTGDTYTAGSGTIMVQTTSFGMAIQGQVQSSAGAINPTMTSNKNSEVYVVGNVALKPSGGAAACTPTLMLLGIGRCG
jgi:hypothetical protein